MGPAVRLMPRRFREAPAWELEPGFLAERAEGARQRPRDVHWSVAGASGWSAEGTLVFPVMEGHACASLGASAGQR